MRILVVEDERHIAQAVEQLLVDYNYAVDIAADGEAGLAMAEAYDYDLIILDIGLPQLDGVEVCKRLRDRYDRTPILLLTGRTGGEHKALALNAGADDYVVKPFEPIELIARVQALLRRPANGSQPILTWGNLTLDPNTRQASYGARLLILTPKEYAILELLLRHPTSPLSSRAILERVWTADEFPADEAVRGHIKELRQKFVAAGAPKDLIKTAYGVGYRFNPLHAASESQSSSSPQMAELAAVNQELRDTLERLRSTQDILRVSEERYRLLSEISPVGIFRNGVDGQCTYVNEKTAQLVGVPPADCLGFNWVNTLHPDDCQWVAEGWHDFVSRSASGDPATHSFECRHLHPDGTLVWVLVNIVPERDAAGAITGYIGTLTDISDRKQAEAALRINDERLRGQKEAFQAAIDGAPLADALDMLARLAAEEIPGVRTAFYIANAEGSCLHPVYGAGQMPDAYLQRVDGLAIGVDSISCGLAIPTGRPVITPDVLAEPLWAPWLDTARDFDYRGCWSFPIQTRDRQGVGTFAMYFGEPRAAQPSDLALAAIVTQSAAIVIDSHFEAVERARAETALRESEEKYRTLFESIDEGFCWLELIYDRAGAAVDYRLLEVNRVFSRQTGLEHVSGKLRTEIAPGFEELDWLENYAQVVQTGEPQRFESHHEPTGRWYQVYVSRVGSAPSRQVTVVFDDITERKRAEAAVRHSEERLRRVLDGMGEGFGLLAPDFTILEHNREALRLDGRTRAEIVGRSHWEVYPDTETSALGRLLKQAMAERVSVSSEHLYAWAEGRERWLEMRAYPTDDGSLAVFWRDVTDRHAAQAALRESAAQYRTLFESIDEGFCTIEVLFDANETAYDCRFLEVNAAFAAQSGLSAAAQKTILELVPNLEPEWIEQYGRVAKSGTAVRFEADVPSMNRVFDIYAFPSDASGGRVVAVLFTDITDRKRAEINTQTSLDIALEAAQMGTWYWDAQRDTAPVRSLQHDRIFGYDTLQPEWGREIARRQILREDWEIYDLAFERAMTTGELDFEVRVLWPDGNIHWMAARGKFDFDLQGHVTAGSGVNFDITERKQAEAEFQAQQRLLEQVTDSTAAILYIYDLVECRNIYTNVQVETILGYSPDAIQAMGTNIFELVHPDDLPILLSAVDRCASAADGEIIESEYRMRDVNGDWHWLQCRDRVLARAADGTAAHMVGTAIDITARKQAETTIAEQAALLDIATDAIFVRCLEHGILYWNRGAERVYGWTSAEALGQPATALLCEPADRIAAIMQTVLERGEWHGELHKFAKSGQELIVEARWTLVCDEAGQPKSILCVDTDVTETTQLQAQFYQAQRLESLGTLASGIAHDLNNVLTPVLAFAQILRRQPGMDEKSQERLQIIEDNARRGADMVGQILTFARGTIGKRIVLQINHLLRDVVKVAQQTFPKSIDFDRHLPAELWLVAGDATQLHQVFLNLCVNARDAMPQGGTLRITAENYALDELFARLNLNVRAGNYVLVTIADTGVGIPPEILDRIFDPFFTTKPIGEGTGLGLATVLGIVTNHGGFVRVTSTVGAGTEFKIYLPAADGEEKPIAPDIASELPTGNGETILVVDDDPAVREANRSILADHHYQTLTASDGIEAMALYAQQMQAIDLVLIDAMMPNASGATAIRTIARMNPQAKILAISGLLSNRDSSIEAGARAFLAKPYQLTDLLTAIADLLAS